MNKIIKTSISGGGAVSLSRSSKESKILDSFFALGEKRAYV